MEKILVALNSGKTTLWSVVHALNLAKRIRARVYILIIPGPISEEKETKKSVSMIQKELSPLIDGARLDGVLVDTYISYGKYDQEIIRFIRENSIDLLIIGIPSSQKVNYKSKFFDDVEKIRQRIDCRIEIVNERDIKIHKRS